MSAVAGKRSSGAVERMLSALGVVKLLCESLLTHGEVELCELKVPRLTPKKGRKIAEAEMLKLREPTQQTQM